MAIEPVHVLAGLVAIENPLAGRPEMTTPVADTVPPFCDCELLGRCRCGGTSKAWLVGLRASEGRFLCCSR